ncbi:hypothetical protein ThrDRAFT_04698 [Frankia casuarinae]|uniref:Twin-arginine translocation pathway signal n=2 Tax=Frankia casuarinae (strain DSM 45818 / CECT 9043 / HFP020203 / CcI3) TaxID=106370 RepID=Q2J7J6_FRACC|nr:MULTISPECIES: helix-turn-helix transcriptional regulator [Frankia]ABD12746.1 Twin-arginine translocation pathway signal [Frankia casuarinae]ESZ99802.1 hypothetical protein CcI6DRAFT_04791 [Frankia sp. CcI6]EYT89683.1 hypothetical protein ThrDRAFT_04698 [Frankia casuarinae]KDA40816.1 hypothetical protein BMG523Draft_04360 [Frankia sp. BMG5.23]KEZ37048.1 hypothetical protein CEDDRAFT_01575 [Frankia sp. CeD]
MPPQPSTHPGWNPGQLRRHREQLGLSRAALADKIANIDPVVAKEAGFTPPAAGPEMISKHERGVNFPGTSYQAAYCHFFQASEPELGFRYPYPHEHKDDHAGSVTPPLAGIPSQHQPTPQTEGVETANRRDLLSLTAAAIGLTATGTAAAMIAPADRLAILERATAGSGAASAAEGALQAVVADYLHHPPAETLRRAIALQQLTDAITAQYPLRPADQARVWRVSGVATGIRGWLENNAGHTTDARLSLREAHRRGELLEDNQLIAWTRFMQATIEDYAGNPAGAEQYALDGLRHAPSGPQRAILLVGSLAGARAAHGDIRGVDAAVSEAESIVSRLTPDERGPREDHRTVVDSLTSIGLPIFSLDVGRVYSRLGEIGRFMEVTADVRPAIEQGSSSRTSVFRADEAVAVARSKSPDLDRVAALARESLRLAGPFQTAHIASRVNVVLAVTDRDYPAIRSLADEAHTWRISRNRPIDLV